MSNSQKPTCFVIAPIGDEGSDTRKRSDKVLAHVFEAALSDEYKVTRADKISEPGLITSQILRALQDSELVLADLSEHNPNVFYELAVRHAIEKPVIHVIDPKWKIPFDVSGFRTIVFDFTDLDSVASAIKQIREQAKETQAGNWGETPIKLANIMRRSKADSPEIVLLKQVVEGMANISERLSNVQSTASSLVYTLSLGGGQRTIPVARLSDLAGIRPAPSDRAFQAFFREATVDPTFMSEAEKAKNAELVAKMAKQTELAAKVKRAQESKRSGDVERTSKAEPKSK